MELKRVHLLFSSSGSQLLVENDTSKISRFALQYVSSAAIPHLSPSPCPDASACLPHRDSPPCPLSTCALIHLGERLQQGDQVAGSSTKDPLSPGRK